VFALEFDGPMMKQKTTLPVGVPTNALSPPQTARILVPAVDVGQTLELTVKGLNRDSALVLTATSTSPVVVENQETSMTVTLGAPPPVDAGSPDAGYCLGPIQVTSLAGFYVVGCEAAATCSACGVGADRCVAGACACGTGAPCGAGLMCVRDNTGVASCRCNQFSGCQGCCASDQKCVPLADEGDARCGAGGFACEACAALFSCTLGVCGVGSACKVANKCASGKQCVSAMAPNCGAPGDRCVSCDLYRSNGCLPTGECGCGGLASCPKAQVCSSSGCITL
jgi:hypothetical protein